MMTEMATGAGPGPAWTVQGQQEQTVIGPGGNPVDVVTVTFRLTDGTTGTVQVPIAAYTVTNVRDAILAKARVLDAVANLGNG